MFTMKLTLCRYDKPPSQTIALLSYQPLSPTTHTIFYAVLPSTLCRFFIVSFSLTTFLILILPPPLPSHPPASFPPRNSVTIQSSQAGQPLIVLIPQSPPSPPWPLLVWLPTSQDWVMQGRSLQTSKECS